MSEQTETAASSAQEPQKTTKKPLKRRILGWAIEILILLVIIIGIRSYMLKDAISGEAPVFSGQFLDGPSMNLRDYRGKPVLVYFWAPWCPICGLMDGTIENLAKDYPVITVAYQGGDNAAIRAHLQKEGLQMPVLVDDAGKLGSAYGVQGIPNSFILDSQGQVRFIEPGLTSSWGLRARLWLAGF
ncbi:protein disulfide oxidoreductase [Candidatus Venteria ishoeyi]|uniref:Thiol-disulfide oxidoreductase ResA n=1 Tax=Candidatus Venteria ishoeyi TaxID=1899563 RepID=A0A1H6FEX1_9GAMM|nr:protein disulfide oxidoreductase [Candidatus Venteria ishoeyi]SEH07716.1 Thiol-disulfide oxidoreductase ResA [Candidatus Venteria ishoeyi]